MIKKICLLLCYTFTLFAGKYEEKLSVLYNSLDQSSLSQLFAFYHLYSDAPEGEQAFKQAWNLVNKHRPFPISPLSELSIFQFDIEAMIALVTKQSYQDLTLLTDSQIQIINHVCSHLKNRNLKGSKLWEISKVDALPVEEIDLARALFLHQFGEKARQEIQTHEAYLDMMALQILSRLDKNPTHLQILEGINHFIFYEMRYRFPPHSMWAKDIDLYTFLPSVLDSRHGVCLGVSILYLSLAQRLDLPLEIITPPGHIYLSFNNGDETINIETTARGIHLPSETYLSINTRTLKKRTLREVIGLNFFNAASTKWHRQEYQKAVDLYEKALTYLPKDPLLYTLLGYNYLFLNKENKGKIFLELALKNPSDEFVYNDMTAKDFLKGKVNAKGIQVIYQEVDETRESILKKQKNIQEILQIYPKFRDGIFHLAITYLQLGRSKEALETLEKYHLIDQNNPTVEYYLATLAMQRYQFYKASKHLIQCEKITAKKNHNPSVLKNLRNSLRKESLLLSQTNLPF